MSKEIFEQCYLKKHEEVRCLSLSAYKYMSLIPVEEPFQKF